MDNITTTCNVTILPSRKELLHRLFNDGHITFAELYILIEKEVVYVREMIPYLPPSDLETWKAQWTIS